jgi:succinate dehydrogenase hydrophobic anchor subunit
MDRINEFNNSTLAKSIHNAKREQSDSRIMLRVGGVVVLLLALAFKYAVGN